MELLTTGRARIESLEGRKASLMSFINYLRDFREMGLPREETLTEAVESTQIGTHEHEVSVQGQIQGDSTETAEERYAATISNIRETYEAKLAKQREKFSARLDLMREKLERRETPESEERRRGKSTLTADCQVQCKIEDFELAEDTFKSRLEAENLKFEEQMSFLRMRHDRDLRAQIGALRKRRAKLELEHAQQIRVVQMSHQKELDEFCTRISGEVQNVKMFAQRRRENQTRASLIDESFTHKITATSASSQFAKMKEMRQQLVSAEKHLSLVRDSAYVEQHPYLIELVGKTKRLLTYLKNN